MLCKSVDELSLKYMENQLETPLKERFESHIKHCKRCRAKFNEIRANYDASLQVDYEVDLSSSIMREINLHEKEKGRIYRRRFRFTPSIAETAEILAIILIMLFVPLVVKQYSIVKDKPKEASVSTFYSPTSFLKNYGIGVKGEPEVFQVSIPITWEVISGEYPEGLYWKLANEFSNDAGLDLSSYKGKSVKVYRYDLAEGLPGQGDQSAYKYPSEIILLVDGEKVIGSWFEFNKWGVGPSIKMHYLSDITGLTYDKWVDNQKIFSDLGKNSDITSLEPIDLMKTFFKAINEKDIVRANSCLTPSAMLDSLTVNMGGSKLYNPGFTQDNSLVLSITQATPISFKLLDSKNFSEIKEVGNRTEIEVKVELNIQWSQSQFNSPTGKEERFAILKKYNNGWRIDGLGTGP